MSLSWRDEIGVHLSSSRLLMVRLGRGLRPQVLAEHEQSLTGGDFNDWGGPLAALEQMLGESSWQRAPSRLVLADCWVRYALVPWSSDLGSPQEQLSHARQMLIRLYGNAVCDWSICLSDAPPGQARIACAIPAALPNAIRDIHRKHGVKLLSLQPQLLAAYGNWRNHLPPSGVWFVSIGDGTLAAARLGARTWDRIHSVRIGAEWTRDLKRLQIFGRLASTRSDEGQVYVDAPVAWREVAGPGAREIHWLEESSGPRTTLQHLTRMRRLAA